jgi:sulfotransferase
MIKKIIGLSGLPRSGSTLLSSILSQNPDIHAEGNSAVCQLMWDMQHSCNGNAKEQLLANNRNKTGKDLISSIPSVYYKDVKAPIIIDKCRSWTLPDNMMMLYNYVDSNPKVIVLERPLIEVIKSFVNLRKENNWQGNLEKGLLDVGYPIERSLSGIKWAKANNKGEFIFIQYDDLVSNPQNIIDSIYEFCGLKSYNHNFNNIVNKHPENDSVYGLLGQHDIRPTINKRNIDVKLSNSIIKKCKQLELENS